MYPHQTSAGSYLVSHSRQWYLTFTFTFGEESMLSSAEAVITFGPMRNPEITERLYKSLRGFCKPQKSVWLNLLKFCDIH